LIQNYTEKMLEGENLRNRANIKIIFRLTSTL
jgi:hypothetical protein